MFPYRGTRYSGGTTEGERISPDTMYPNRRDGINKPWPENMDEKPYRTCIRCGQELNQPGDSEEHIIPNSIGGRRTTKRLQCVRCNNADGSSWESAIATAFAGLCILFGITRDRGTPRAIVVADDKGQEFLLGLDGTLSLPAPHVEKVPGEGYVSINIKTSDETQARKILGGFAKKYQNLDVEGAMEAVESNDVIPPPVKIYVPLFDQNIEKLAVKSAIAMVVSAGGNPHQCLDAKKFLLGDDSKVSFGPFYGRDLLVDRPRGVPLHCIYVSANSGRPILGYLELFGYLRIVMFIGSSFQGAPLEAMYTVDPRNGQPVNVKFDANFSEDDVRMACGKKEIHAAPIHDALKAVLAPAIDLQHKHAISRVVDKAFRYAIANCEANEGEPIAGLHGARFMQLVMEQLQPWLYRSCGTRADQLNAHPALRNSWC